jgi:hypothetical protein
VWDGWEHAKAWTPSSGGTSESGSRIRMPLFGVHALACSHPASLTVKQIVPAQPASRLNKLFPPSQPHGLNKFGWNGAGNGATF